MKTRKNALRDYIKANRRATREAEIENHSRPVNFCRVHKSKKVYDRKRRKADDKRHLPSFLLYDIAQGIFRHVDRIFPIFNNQNLRTKTAG